MRRPNFDRHGAWFTLGNLELHLIKGVPLVHSGDDLIVGHISLECEGGLTKMAEVKEKLDAMGVYYRQNISVPVRVLSVLLVLYSRLRTPPASRFATRL